MLDWLMKHETLVSIVVSIVAAVAVSVIACHLGIV